MEEIQQITEELKEIPQIKYLKLKNGECIVAMVEWGKGDESDQLTLYNPFKVVYGEIEIDGVSVQGLKMPCRIEEWMPSSIVVEQVCIIFQDDILTMVDVNEGFSKAYTKKVIQKAGLEELVRRGDLFNDKTANDMKLSEDETEERTTEEFGEFLEERLKKFRSGYN